MVLNFKLNFVAIKILLSYISFVFHLYISNQPHHFLHPEIYQLFNFFLFFILIQSIQTWSFSKTSASTKLSNNYFPNIFHRLVPKLIIFFLLQPRILCFLWVLVKIRGNKICLAQSDIDIDDKWVWFHKKSQY